MPRLTCAPLGIFETSAFSAYLAALAVFWIILESSLFRKANLPRQIETTGAVGVLVGAHVLKAATRIRLNAATLTPTRMQCTTAGVRDGVQTDHRELTCTSVQRALIRAPELLMPHPRSTA